MAEQRGQGTWARLDEGVHDHPKTGRLSVALRALGVPELYASDVAVGQLHRLSCWCLRNGDDGEIGHLTATRFAQIVRWSDLSTAEELLDAWRASGFLDKTANGYALHEFEQFFRDVLRKRQARRKSAETKKAQKKASKEASPSKEKAGRPPVGQRATAGRTTGALTGNRKPEGINLLAEVQPPGGGRDSPIPKSDPEPPDSDPPDPSEDLPPPDPPDADSADPPSPVRAGTLAFARQLAERNLPPLSRSETGHLGRALKEVVASSGLDPGAVCQLVETWFSDDFGAQAGYHVSAFRDRVRALLVGISRQAEQAKAKRPPKERPMPPPPTEEEARRLDAVVRLRQRKQAAGEGPYPTITPEEIEAEMASTVKVLARGGAVG